ncbi:MAG: Stk1 family PASTA domain-containing Ser/Thr kinase [Eggerthellaceae bacterium]|nr:Stk1 family PASTA domain-containing Ser/Thr kinase [Eggerthellaceae bacterium]
MDRIGIGGMAEVYRAQDNVLGRRVAVKVMLPQYAADAEFTQRFRQEAAAAANLQSPYIVNVYDWGQDGGTYYIVMEFVRGSDLKTAINQRGAINQRKVAEIGSQVCQALTVAHNLDIVHRDIKPQNIMVQPDGNVKVMDFGIARAKNSVKQKTEAVLGTAHYISPEQAQGKELTAASDIYSLGIAMYEATTGKLPFDGPDAVNVAMQQVSETPLPPSEINPRIDPDLEDIIMCALAKDPRDRFATANDMRLALNDYLAGRPVNLRSSRRGAAKTRVMGTVGAAAGARTAYPNAGAEAGATQVMPNTMKPAGAVKPIVTAGPGGTGGFRRIEEPPSQSKTPILVGIIVALLVVIAAAAFFLLGGNGDDADGIPVPDVIGMTVEEAEDALEEAGFVLGKVEEAFDEAPEGEVILQDPVAETLKAEGSKINVTVSKGKEQVEVPNFLNMTVEEAKEIAAKYDLLLEPLPADYSTEIEVNKIMDQSPKAGEKVAKGSTVQYVISLGTESVTVPNVVSYKEAEAVALLTQAGFKVEVERMYSDFAAAGIVIDQSPKSGKHDKGTTIKLAISLGPEPKPEPTPTPEPDPEPTPEPPSNGEGGESGGTPEGGAAQS